MKKICVLLILLIASVAKADDISQYKFYATDNFRDDQQPEFAAYIKNGDPCIQVKNLTTHKEVRFCQITKGINLADDPNIYPFDINFSGHRLYFFVAAYWADQACTIELSNMTISCELKNKPKKEEDVKAEHQKAVKKNEVVIPPAVKHIEFGNVKEAEGLFRLILNNSEMNPCFTIEHYSTSLFDGPTNIKHVCSAINKTDDSIIDLIGKDGNWWFENFNWQGNNLAFEINAMGGNYKCELPLPFTEQSEALCVR